MTTPWPFRTLSNVSLISFGSIPLLQSSTNMVLNPSSWAWSAVQPGEIFWKNKMQFNRMKIRKNCTNTDIRGNPTNISISDVLAPQNLFKLSTAELFVVKECRVWVNAGSGPFKDNCGVGMNLVWNYALLNTGLRIFTNVWFFIFIWV